MSIYEKWNEAWNNNDATAAFECFHDDFEFKFHSSRNVMKKSDMSVEMMTKMMQMKRLQTNAVFMKMMTFAFSTRFLSLQAVTKKPL